jgi:hypothetical protein
MSQINRISLTELNDIFGPPSFNTLLQTSTVQKRELNLCNLVLGIAAMYVIIKGVVYILKNYQIVKAPTIVKSKKVKEKDD